MQLYRTVHDSPSGMEVTRFRDRSQYVQGYPDQDSPYINAQREVILATHVALMMPKTGTAYSCIVEIDISTRLGARQCKFWWLELVSDRNSISDTIQWSHIYSNIDWITASIFDALVTRGKVQSPAWVIQSKPSTKTRNVETATLWHVSTCLVY